MKLLRSPIIHRKILILFDLIRLEHLAKQAAFRRLFNLLLNVVPQVDIAVLRGTNRVRKRGTERATRHEIFILVTLYFQ